MSIERLEEEARANALQPEVWMRLVEAYKASSRVFAGKTLDDWITSLEDDDLRQEADLQLQQLGPLATAALLVVYPGTHKKQQARIVDTLTHMPPAALAPFSQPLQALIDDPQVGRYHTFYLTYAIARAGVVTEPVVRRLTWLAMRDFPLRRWEQEELGKQPQEKIEWQAEEWLREIGLNALFEAMFGLISYEDGIQALEALDEALFPLGVAFLHGMFLGVLEGYVIPADFGSYDLQWFHAIKVLATLGGEEVAQLFDAIRKKDPDKFPQEVLQEAKRALVAMGFGTNDSPKSGGVEAQALPQGSADELLEALLERFAQLPDEHHARIHLLDEIAAAPLNNTALRGPLLEYVLSEETRERFAWWAIYVLEERQDIDAVPTLLEVARQTSKDDLRRRIFYMVRALGQHKEAELLLPLLSHEQSALRAHAAEALLHIDAGAFGAEVIELMCNDPEDDVRWQLFGPSASRAPKAFEEALVHLIPWVKRVIREEDDAAYELFEVLDESENPVLLPLYEEAARMPGTYVYSCGLKGLGRLGDVSHIPLFLDGFKHLADEPQDVFDDVIEPLGELSWRLGGAPTEAKAIAPLVIRQLSTFLQQLEENDTPLDVSLDHPELDGREEVKELLGVWEQLAA